ncbi:MAG: hypothetical protein VX929_00475, partial [Pseudomonadota bacterium]|nr:hypothetical protein [Pseudomonadota bacterium]
MFSSNAPFIEDLYESYLLDPDEVSEDWRKYFDGLQNGRRGGARDVRHSEVQARMLEIAVSPKAITVAVSAGSFADSKKQVSVLQLI